VTCKQVALSYWPSPRALAGCAQVQELALYFVPGTVLGQGWNWVESRSQKTQQIEYSCAAIGTSLEPPGWQNY